jgi:hypothetical protein
MKSQGALIILLSPVVVSTIFLWADGEAKTSKQTDTQARDNELRLSIPQESDAELRMSIAAMIPQEAKGITIFRVTLENVGDKDTVLNLGMMLANGKVLLPDAIRLVLIDPDGKCRKLHFADRRYPGIAGRVDNYAVPLRAGSAYTLRLSLGNFWCPEMKEFRLDLKPGAYRVRSELTGKSARCANPDMEGVTLMNFWKGTLQSSETVFRIE